MRGSLILMLCLVLAGSCKKDTTPKGILKQEQMVDWLIDIYLAESRAGSLAVNRDSVYKLFVPYQDSLMHKKGVNDSILMVSYHYYLDHPAELEVIYDAVIDSLNLREQRLRNTQP